jgi:hypothetical protein
MASPTQRSAVLEKNAECKFSKFLTGLAPKSVVLSVSVNGHCEPIAFLIVFFAREQQLAAALPQLWMSTEDPYDFRVQISDPPVTTRFPTDTDILLEQ